MPQDGLVQRKGAAEDRGYAICRSAKGGYKAFRVRARGRSVPEGWQLADTACGWSKARARVAALAAQREAEFERTVAAANSRIRTHISPRALGGRRLLVTERDLAEKGLAGALSGVLCLDRREVAYLRWVDAGRPSL